MALKLSKKEAASDDTKKKARGRRKAKKATAPAARRETMPNNVSEGAEETEASFGLPESARPTQIAIPPLIERSQRAFAHSLPTLLEQHYREWVAFHGDELVGFASREIDLYERCRERGWRDDEFSVRYVAPESFGEIMLEELVG